MSISITSIIQSSVDTKLQILQQEALLNRITELARATTNCFRQGGKLLLCGNGGSAADAQHLAAELSGRFYLNRPPLPAEALHVNTSFLTAVANDYGYDQVYARMTEALGQKGDLLWAFSTSGNSPNILLAIEKAHSVGMKVAGFTGSGGGKMAGMCDWLINVPSDDTPRIQESHIMIGHILCEWIEHELFLWKGDALA
jgi:D-sedoheptulose 7-phosphate isomerase